MIRALTLIAVMTIPTIAQSYTCALKVHTFVCHDKAEYLGQVNEEWKVTHHKQNTCYWLPQGTIMRFDYKYEYTDTFGGEANYSWVTKGIVKAKDTKQAARLARIELGLTGTKGDVKLNQGDEFWWSPRNDCTILFISFDDGEMI